MALQPAVITSLPCYSSEGCRCGVTRTSTSFCLHVEKLQFGSRVYPTYSFNGQGRSMHPSGVALTKSSQTFSAVLGEVSMTANAVGHDVLREQLKSASLQVERTELAEAIPAPQEARSIVEGLNEPLGLAAIDPNGGVKASIEPSGLNARLEGLKESAGSATIDSLTEDGASVSSLSPPPQPGAASFDQSPDLEILRSNAEGSIGAAGAAADSSQEAANTVTDALSTDHFKSAKEAYEALLSGSQDASDQESSIDVLSQASQSLSGGLSDVKSAVMNGFTRVQESLQGSVESARMAFKSTYDKINGSIINSFKNDTGLDENARTLSEPTAVKNVASQESLIDILTSPFHMGTPVNNTLKQIVTTVENVTGKVLVGSGELVVNGYTSTKQVLPVNAQVYLSGIEKKMIEVSGPLQIALKQVYTVILDAEKAVGINPENPIIPIFVIFGGSISLGILYRQLQYGGYSGDLAPGSALDLLKKEANIVLIDIRSEELRESQGMPDLRRQARFKAASVEQFKVEGSLQRMLRNAADAEAAITAAAIRNLKNVQRNTKVILLDSDGSQSKSIARALKRAGIKMAFRIDGGFRAWEGNGLRIKQVGPETAISIIKEETEAILDEVKPTPSGIAAATLGVVAGIYALIEWEKTLQLLGLVCIGQALYKRLNSYDTAEDAKNDLKLLLRPFVLATQGIVWAVGVLEPSKLQLATSPSTSAVQDRVLQAAAKHGPLPSEYDQEQQEDQPVEGLSPKGVENDSAVQD